VEYQGRYITNGYEVRFDPIEGKWCWWYYDETEDQPYYDDPYQAKAAAQADYEARTSVRFRKVEVPDMFEAEEFLNSKDIFHHPYITDRTDSESYSVAELMAQFFEWNIAKAKDNTI
jgi:hypothetical protein